MTNRATEFAASKQAFLNYYKDPRGQLFYQMLQAHLQPYLPNTPLRILDVGCGFGSIDLWLAQQGQHVTGIDITPELLDVARANAEDAGVTIDYREFNINEQQLSELGDPYDIALCHNVLEYVQNADHTLAKIADIIVPGGLLSLVSHNPNAKVLQAALYEQDPALALSKLDQHTYFVNLIQAEVPIFTAAELTSKLDAHGFDLIAHSGIRTLYDYINTPKRTDPTYHQQALELELALSSRTPFREMAAFTHLVARKRS